MKLEERFISKELIWDTRDTYFNKNDAYNNNNGWYTCPGVWQEVQKRAIWI